mgnify:FL=1
MKMLIDKRLSSVSIYILHSIGPEIFILTMTSDNTMYIYPILLTDLLFVLLDVQFVLIVDMDEV